RPASSRQQVKTASGSMPCAAARRSRRTARGSATATTLARSGWVSAQPACSVPRLPAPTTARVTGGISSPFVSSERPDRDRLCPSGSFPDADGLQERAYRLAGTPGFQLARTPDGRWPGRPTAARASSSPAEAQRPRAGQEPHMFEHHLAALIGLSQAQDLAYSALPD